MRKIILIMMAFLSRISIASDSETIVLLNDTIMRHALIKRPGKKKDRALLSPDIMTRLEQSKKHAILRPNSTIRIERCDKFEIVTFEFYPKSLGWFDVAKCKSEVRLSDLLLVLKQDKRKDQECKELY